jgi:hypothetical protein
MARTELEQVVSDHGAETAARLPAYAAAAMIGTGVALALAFAPGRLR